MSLYFLSREYGAGFYCTPLFTDVFADDIPHKINIVRNCQVYNGRGTTWDDFQKIGNEVLVAQEITPFFPPTRV